MMSEEEWSYNNVAAENNDYYRVGMEYIDLENVIGSNQGQGDIIDGVIGDSIEQGLSMKDATEGYAV